MTDFEDFPATPVFTVVDEQMEGTTQITTVVLDGEVEQFRLTEATRMAILALTQPAEVSHE